MVTEGGQQRRDEAPFDLESACRKRASDSSFGEVIFMRDRVSPSKPRP